MKDEYVSKEAVIKYIRKVAETAYGANYCPNCGAKMDGGAE